MAVRSVSKFDLPAAWLLPAHVLCPVCSESRVGSPAWVASRSGWAAGRLCLFTAKRRCGWRAPLAAPCPPMEDVACCRLGAGLGAGWWEWVSPADWHGKVA